MQGTIVPTDYLQQLEDAVAAAEWWLADIETAKRKGGGEEKRKVFAAADAMRDRRASPPDAGVVTDEMVHAFLDVVPDGNWPALSFHGVKRRLEAALKGSD